jgi:hypothetical protein
VPSGPGPARARWARLEDVSKVLTGWYPALWVLSRLMLDSAHEVLTVHRSLRTSDSSGTPAAPQRPSRAVVDFSCPTKCLALARPRLMRVCDSKLSLILLA